MLSEPLTSHAYYNFEVIASRSYGVDASLQDSAKLLIAGYLKTFRVNWEIKFLPSSCHKW